MKTIIGVCEKCVVETTGGRAVSKVELAMLYKKAMIVNGKVAVCPDCGEEVDLLAVLQGAADWLVIMIGRALYANDGVSSVPMVEIPAPMVSEIARVMGYVADAHKEQKPVRGPNDVLN